MPEDVGNTGSRILSTKTVANFDGSNATPVVAIPGYSAAKKALENINRSKAAWAKQRTKIEESQKFYAGDQWAQADKAVLEDEKRIPVVFNYSAKHIDAIVGAELHNRQDTRFVPRYVDPQNLPQLSTLGELETSAYDWVMDLCNGEDECSLAFQDMLTGGMGWTEVFTDAAIEKDIRILVRRIDPLEVMFDSTAKMQNMEDARWLARIKLIPLEEACHMWPEREVELRVMADNAAGYGFDQTPEQLEETGPILYEPNRINITPGLEEGKKGMVPVIQYQWFDFEDVYKIKDPKDEKEKEFTEKSYKRLKKRAEELGTKLESAKYTKRVYKQIFIAGNELPLTDEEELPVQSGGFTFKVMTGKWDQAEKCWRGLLYQLMDPQMYTNKYLSQVIHIINSNPKGGLMAEADAFKDPSRVQRDWAKPNTVLLVEKGALQEKRIDVRPIMPMPDASFRMMQWCVEAMTGVAGMNIEMLGQSEGDQPALTMRQRMVQGMQINAIYFNALTRFRRNQARTVLEFIREFVADGRMVRIAGPFSAQALPLLKSDISPEYDVVIDEAIRSPNAKAEVWAGLQPIMPVIVRSGFMIPELVDLVPGLPQSLAAKIKEKMGAEPPQPQKGRGGQGAQGKAPPDPMEQQAKIAKLQEEVNLIKAKEAEVAARARNLDKQSQLKEMAMMTDSRHKQEKVQTDRLGLQAKNQRETQQAELKRMQMLHKMSRDAFRGVRNPPSESGQ